MSVPPSFIHHGRAKARRGGAFVQVVSLTMSLPKQGAGRQLRAGVLREIDRAATRKRARLVAHL